MTEIKDRSAEQTETAKGLTASNAGKLKYVAPTLKTYGAVSAMTQNNPGVNAGDAKSKMTTPSDRSLKENIVRVGTHDLGIGLYLFDYKMQFKDRFGHERRLGVMADEVETVMPSAVVMHPEGFKTVNYGALGLQ